MRKFLLTYLFLGICLFGLGQEPQEIFDIQVPKGKPVFLSVSPDGLKLLVVSKTEDSSYIFSYELVNDKWQNPMQVFSAKRVASAHYNFDNSKIYLSADMGKGNFDLYILTKGEAIALDSFNTELDEIGLIMDFNEKLAFFIRKDVDEQCGNIYIAQKVKQNWHKPQLLIAPVNLGCEYSIFLANDGKTFVFASKRGNDKNVELYFTKMIMKDIWLIPQKLPDSDPKMDDISPTIDFKNNRLLFIKSNLKKDRYTIVWKTLNPKIKPEPILMVKGQITDLYNKPLNNVEIKLLNPTTNMPYNVYQTNELGHYQFFVNPSNDYVIEYGGGTYSTYFKSLPSENLESFSVKNIDVQLFTNVNLQLNVFDRENFEPLDVKFTILNSKGESIRTNLKSIDKGRYLLSLPIGDSYEIICSNEYYKTDTLKFDVRGAVIYQQFEKDIELQPLLYKVVLKVLDKNSKQGVRAEIQLVNLRTGKRELRTLTTDEAGNVVLYLRKGETYDITVAPVGYTFYHAQLDLENNPTPEVVAEVEKLTEETKIEFHNITFETNSAELKEDAFAELDRLVELMKKNPNIKVEISAHTDDVGPEDYNMKLSLRRAQAVVNYLKEHGIPESRMIARGYGETRPLVPNDSEEHRAMNRRVELRIIEIEEQNQ